MKWLRDFDLEEHPMVPVASFMKIVFLCEGECVCNVLLTKHVFTVLFAVLFVRKMLHVLCCGDFWGVVVAIVE